MALEGRLLAKYASTSAESNSVVYPGAVPEVVPGGSLPGILNENRKARGHVRTFAKSKINVLMVDVKLSKNFRSQGVSIVF